jgi:diguanylate cyclase (GGDEF)-like protein
MTLLIASAEIVSLLFLLPILISLRYKDNDNKEKGSEKASDQFYLLCLIIATILGLAFDAASYLLEGHCKSNVLLYLTILPSYALIDLCLFIFSFYMLAIIRRTKDVPKYAIYPSLAICILDIVLIIIGHFTGKFFTLTDYSREYGPWSDFITLLPAVAIIALLVILVKNIKHLGMRNATALSSFAILPLIAGILVIISPDLQLGYIAAALSCAIIFTFIKQHEINEAYIREKILDRVSSQDVLTGLVNRRGFENAINQASEHHHLDVVFCDLNALKYINDNFGHTAGDNYIQRFADILRLVFENHGLICRISGDEFVVLLYDISPADFDRLKEKLAAAIKNEDRIASVGYASGESSEALALIRCAEQEMYDDKKRYYSETGRDRRRRSK